MQVIDWHETLFVCHSPFPMSRLININLLRSGDDQRGRQGAITSHDRHCCVKCACGIKRATYIIIVRTEPEEIR